MKYLACGVTTWSSRVYTSGGALSPISIFRVYGNIQDCLTLYSRATSRSRRPELDAQKPQRAICALKSSKPYMGIDGSLVTRSIVFKISDHKPSHSVDWRRQRQIPREGSISSAECSSLAVNFIVKQVRAIISSSPNNMKRLEVYTTSTASEV
ncbi:hypothetical protein O988_00251 [Pseudogymnoascus sp. VKM F-3808]|nr:hypothetical protein O988_00251 [Pseudogymnoascus sp. VKM F-3808]